MMAICREETLYLTGLRNWSDAACGVSCALKPEEKLDNSGVNPTEVRHVATGGRHRELSR